MTIYYFLFLSFFLFHTFFKKGSCFGERKFLRACIYGLFVFLILALRHPSMGIDLNYKGLHGYLPNFDLISSLSFKELIKASPFMHYEIGYILMNWLLGLLSKNYQVLLAICAFLSIAPVAYLYYKKSDSIELSYIIYLSLQSFLICFSGLRQGISVGICMIAFLFIQKKQFGKFIFFVLIAMSFHSSAIIYLIAYPMYYLNIKKENRWFTIAILLVAFFFKVPLFKVLSKILKDNAEVNTTNSFTFFLVFCAVYVFCFMFAKDNETNNGYLNLVFCGCFCLIFTSVFATAMRASYCFLNMLPLILPKVINEISNENLRVIVQIIIVCCFMLFALSSLYSTFWTKSFPYIFFWE